jgi:hypothetical protein
MKKHTRQTHEQKHGQFFTTNAEDLLGLYTHLLRDKDVIDPFAGDCDLLHFAVAYGARSVEGYDLEPRQPAVSARDSILNPPAFTGKFLLTNPPYLASNKNKDKGAYAMWGQSDLYKCHIASFADDLDEGVIILPTNFLSESRPKARELFFSRYTITQCDYYYYQVFPNTTTGITIFAFRRDSDTGERRFPCRIHYSSSDVRYVELHLERKYDWLHGKDFFDFIKGPERPIGKWTGKESGFLTNIVVGLLDAGRAPQGLSINKGDPIVCRDTTFTTYQMVLDVDLPPPLQERVVELFNEKMQKFRQQYHGLFLSNYMGATQKIYSRSMVAGLFWKCLELAEAEAASVQSCSSTVYFDDKKGESTHDDDRQPDTGNLGLDT